jgi:high-affinity Fe2+/Pb2+ permease
MIEHAILAALTQDSPRGNPAGPLLMISGVLAVVAIGFLMAAGYDWLLTQYDLQTARLYMGGFVFLLAALFAVVAMAIYSYRQRKIRAYYEVVKDNFQHAMTIVGEELEEPIRENPKTAMLIAGLAGYIAAEKILH